MPSCYSRLYTHSRICLYSLLFKKSHSAADWCNDCALDGLDCFRHMITSTKWGWDSWVWPSVIRRGLFPVSPCLTHIHTQPQLLHSDSYSESISGSLTFPNRSHWHWEGVNVCLVHTLTRKRTVSALTFPPQEYAQTHTSTHQGRRSRERRRDRWLGRSPQGEHFEWGAFQIQNRWSDWCQSRRVAGGSRCRQPFGRGKVVGVWISSIKVRRRAEINTTVWYHHLTDWWFLSRSIWGGKTLGYYYRAVFSAQLSPLHT